MNSFQRILCVECKINYGSEQRQGMCSVCFKTKEISKPLEQEQEQEEDYQYNNNIIKIDENNIKNETEEIKQEQKVEEVKNDDNKIQQKSKFHCFTCETKVGYLGFKCKCEYIYCGKHRHFSEHNCTFDFRAYDRERLNMKNK